MASVEIQAQLVEDLDRLGLKAGDTVLVRCAAQSIAPGQRGLPKTLRDALLARLGPVGTLIALTFTDIQPSWTRERRAVFKASSGTVSGGFAREMLNHPQRIRSSHPMNSIAAIGPNAELLTRGHDRSAAPFSWISRLIESKGKQLLIGCVDRSPGFSTVHYNQEVLNLAGRSLMSGFTGCYIELGDNQLEWAPRKIVPGCSMGFWKLYAHYVRAGVLRTGYIGAAYSVLVDADAAYAVEREVLANDPHTALCDRPDCLSCTTWTYNKRAWPSLAARIVARAGQAVTRRFTLKRNGQ
jgi:aminoglycoside 3-N-acetyltransferase